MTFRVRDSLCEYLLVSVARAGNERSGCMPLNCDQCLPTLHLLRYNAALPLHLDKHTPTRSLQWRPISAAPRRVAARRMKHETVRWSNTSGTRLFLSDSTAQRSRAAAHGLCLRPDQIGLLRVHWQNSNSIYWHEPDCHLALVWGSCIVTWHSWSSCWRAKARVMHCRYF